MKISVGISNRHVHLKKEDFNILFGERYELKKLKDLKQPGQYASCEKVTLVGPKGKIEDVRIIGPIRDYTQIEISKTDSYQLGLNPPIRKSGDILESSPIKLVGPVGSVELEFGCIISERHIHITPEQMNYYGLNEFDEISIYVSGEKETILKNVHLRIAEKSYFELHLDTDDANSCLIKNGDIVDIIIK